MSAIINGRTPEEIKKGLVEAIEEASWVVEGGDAHDLIDTVEKAHVSMAYALTYIQQLERERDMAVDDIECGICCETCAHYDTPSSDQPCATCNKGWAKHGNWQWHGVQEVE